MKVYCVYEGSVHEGGGVTEIYSNEESAIKFAIMKVHEEQKHFDKIHGQSDFAKRYRWKEEKYDFPVNFIKSWSNEIDCITVYEQEVKD